MATYGIDLGTTNSCIAYVDDTGRPVVLKSAVGEDTTPSVVYFESPENVVVGRQAKDSAVLAPDLVAEMVKRQMGQDVHYTFHGQVHTPESISALILRELARAAQEQTGEEVRDVVITVPAYFGVLERDATRKAGEIAGLNVLDVLAEPVAAALEYQALGEHAGVRHIFVYDLGGGTFDTTVIRLEGDDITVVCTDGNHQLGGADWDAKIIDFLLRGFTDQYPDLDPSGDEQFMQDLATSAEPGDPFDRDRHRPLAVVACQDESRHNTVAEVVAAGFAERETGRVRRPVQARFYQYTPGRGEPGAASDTAQPQ